MAFTFNSGNNNSNGANNDSWKAQAFLNLWISDAAGKRVKVGAIALRDSRADEADLIEALQHDGAMEHFVKALEIDFQLANKPREGNRFGFLNTKPE